MDPVVILKAVLAAVSVAVTLAVTGVLKKLIANIPVVVRQFVVPIIATAIAAGVNYLLAQAGGPGFNPYLAALYAFVAGVVARAWQAANEPAR